MGSQLCSALQRTLEKQEKNLTGINTELPKVEVPKTPTKNTKERFIPSPSVQLRRG